MRRRTFELVVAVAMGASACCLNDISGIDLEGGDAGHGGDAGDAGTLEKDRGCPTDQVYMGICWCEPHFGGCLTEGFCFFEDFDAGCIHADCLDAGWDDDNCGRCGNACKPKTHCGYSESDFGEPTCLPGSDPDAGN